MLFVIVVVVRITSIGKGMVFEMRSVYINIGLAILSLAIGIWLIEKRLSEEEINWIGLALTAPMNFFVSGWCFLVAWHKYQSILLRHQSPALTDLGVNWSRDGF